MTILSSAGYKYIGFVLTAQDPYCIVDLDDKEDKPATQEEREVHERIINEFDTYIERSASGRGFHIVCKASINQGRRRGTVEIYSQDRYMIFTGDVIKDKPVIDCQSHIASLLAEMPNIPKPQLLEQIDSDISDAAVIEKASNAKNGEKFDKLCNGDWQNDYKSQSEADFALISILCFYTKDNAQVRRLFRFSQLGKRDKANRDAYLNYAIRKIRGVEMPEINFNALISNMDVTQSNLLNATSSNVDQPKLKEFSLPTPSSENEMYESVPGLIGEIAEYIYKSSVRPVREIALAAAFAIAAGVAGRAFNISGTGLNLYIILLARTGSGKEGAASGIDRLLSAVRPNVPIIDQFMGPAVFGSGQALLKHLNEKPCFLSILGEFGLTLQSISSENANNAERNLKTVLLDLYSKSGHGSVLRAIVYSDKDKNTKDVRSPNVTILGESTPETFLEPLTESQITEGLIPRFTFIAYEGKRPARNDNARFPPDIALINKFSELVAVSLKKQSQQLCINVQVSPDAEELLSAFDKFADKNINNAQDEVNKHLWNRAHLKALKLAALISVGINPHEPIVNVENAVWAIRFVNKDISYILNKFETGDYGTGDGKQLADLRATISAYYQENKGEDYSKTYRFPHVLILKGIIPFAYIQRRSVSMSSFRKDKMNATFAIKRSIETLIADGFLVECDKTYIKREFDFGGRCFTVTKFAS